MDEQAIAADCQGVAAAACNRANRLERKGAVNLADIEAEAKRTLEDKERAIERDREVAGKFLLAKLLQFTDSNADVATISISSEACSDDEGGSYIHVWATVSDAAEEQIDGYEELFYEIGVDGVEHEVVWNVFGEWEGSLTWEQIKTKAEALGIAS